PAVRRRPRSVQACARTPCSIPWHAKRALSIGADEIDDLHHLGIFRIGQGAILDPLLEGPFFRKKQTIGSTQIMYLIARKPATLQTHDVQPGEVRMIADGEAKRNEISGH